MTWADGSRSRPMTSPSRSASPRSRPSGRTSGTTSATPTATDASTVVVKFNDPAYQQWATWTYNSPILPKHIWEAKANDDILKDTNANGVGSGPYVYQTATQDRMVWVRNDGWWGKTALGLEVKPKYIVDIVNGANNVALGLLLQGGIDLSNNFLPGIATLVDKGYVSTYFKAAPYMLSGNTAWLVTNDQEAAPRRHGVPHRRSPTRSTCPDIVNKVYGNIVKAADPTGLLPTWDKYIDTAQRDALGFTYDPAKSASDPRRRRLQEGRRRLLHEQGRLGDQAHDHGPERLVRLGGRARHHRRQPQGRRHQHRGQDHRLQRPGRRPQRRQLRPGHQQRGPDVEHAVDVLRLHVPPAAQEGAAKNRNYGSLRERRTPGPWCSSSTRRRSTTSRACRRSRPSSRRSRSTRCRSSRCGTTGSGRRSATPSGPTGRPTRASHILPATWNGYWQMGAMKMLTEIQPVPPAVEATDAWDAPRRRHGTGGASRPDR